MTRLHVIPKAGRQICWALIASLIPAAKPGDRDEHAWHRAIAGRFPAGPDGACFLSWRGMGLWQSIQQLLVMTAREIAGREAQPGAAVINSQSICTRSFCALSGKFSCSRGKAGQSLVC